MIKIEHSLLSGEVKRILIPLLLTMLLSLSGREGATTSWQVEIFDMLADDFDNKREEWVWLI